MAVVLTFSCAASMYNLHGQALAMEAAGTRVLLRDKNDELVLCTSTPTSYIIMFTRARLFVLWCECCCEFVSVCNAKTRGIISNSEEIIWSART